VAVGQRAWEQGQERGSGSGNGIEGRVGADNSGRQQASGGRESKGKLAEGVQGRQMTCTQRASSWHADSAQTASKSMGRWQHRQEEQWCTGGGCIDLV